MNSTGRHSKGVPGIVVHQTREWWIQESWWLDTVFGTLQHVCLCTTPEFSVAVLDSALRTGNFSSADLLTLGAVLPSRLAPVLAAADGRTESGLESLTRFRLRSAGFEPQVQVEIPSVGRVDLVIGNVIIELDGWEFHRDTFESDRRRDAAAAARGYITLRFSYRQVLDDWDSVLAAVVAATRHEGRMSS